jgi:rhodanese-related sulfurtransferase
MFESIKKLLGITTTNYAQLIKEGAIILDVRTSSEFSSGHIKGSINIPVDKIVQNVAKLKAKNKTIITCCASGIRSATAKSILLSNGITNVYNGGAWHRLNMKING